ncbi:MAG: hypothetical protein J3K34DRAFT_518018 [Monoraphidium minutum]|nr:MAG: hypothetical protein J3K34DRAFT_518018 [Monoraphidium minutum]
MSDADSSKHSYSTGTSGAASSASDNSDAAALNALQDRGGDNDESLNDLMDSSRKLDEGFFATLMLLNKNRDSTDIRLVLLRVLLECLQLFRIVFNSYFNGWDIDKNNIGFKAIKWVLIRGLVFPKGYDMYIRVFYALAAIILLSLAMAAWLAIVLKKDDTTQGGWTGKLIGFLQLLCFVLYTCCWITVMDYLVFLFDCKWTAVASGPANVVHLFFGNSCLAMPHLAHMSFAVVVVIVFSVTCVAMSVGDCDLNPLTRNVLATPSAAMHIKVVLCKMGMIILAACGDENSKLQVVVMALLMGFILFQMILSCGYYGTLALHTWVGLLSGISVTSCMLVFSTFYSPTHPETPKLITECVLYVIFPTIAVGVGISMARVWWLRRPLEHLAEAFKGAERLQDFKTVYRFRDYEQVEMLSRVMRKWDEDGVPDPEAVAFGEFIMKCGAARFPNNAALMIATANMHIVARHDGQAARTQLQLAVKASPSLIQRYFIFVTQDLTKRLKDETDGLDLAGYIEFQRNYRAVVRSHKMALSAQRSLWMVLLHDTIQFKSLQRSFAVMNQAEARATAVYRKVLERYPNNGRLLKVYGRFLEYCKNDPWTANRYYMEAMKQGTTESLMALIGGGKDSAEGITQTLGSVNEREDGLVIINASGLIMAVNKPTLSMFGYEKGDLEQKNVSCLMPQPFSSRHNGYLSHYAQTGEARIINTTRHVIGLSKGHALFPITLSVVKISGTRDEATFLGVIRPSAAGANGAVRVWVAPGSGLILTADEAYAHEFGTPVSELAGRLASSLGPDIEALDRLVAEATSLPPSQANSSKLKIRTQLLHRFLPPVDVEIAVEFAGSDVERIIVLNISCVVPSGALMVVSHRGRIVYTTGALGAMLGIPAKQLATMDLQAIVPPPFSQLHANYFKNMGATPPVTSCRAGAVVHLLCANGVKVPVTLQISTHDDGERLQHVVRVTPSSDAECLDRQRLVLGVGESGAVLSVNPGAAKALFGFQPQMLVGRHLSSFLTVFRDYKAQAGGRDNGVGLLTALGMRALEGATDDAWRVGVAVPKDGKDGATASEAASSALAVALQQRNRERPALMSIKVLDLDENDAAADGAAAAAAAASGGGGVPAGAPAAERAAMEVTLWRAAAVAAVVEVDSRLQIKRVDAAAGLLFGVSSRSMIKKDFRKLAGLPESTRPSDLLLAASKGGKDRHNGKKSGLKGGGAAKTGARRMLLARHADGGEVKVEMQAVTKPGGSDQLVLRLQLLEPSCGSLEPLLALQRAGAAAPGAKLPQAASEGGSGSEGEEAERGAGGARGAAAGARGSAALERDEGDEEGSEHGVASCRDGRSPVKPRGRVEEWVKQVSRLHDDDGEGDEEGGRGRARSRSRSRPPAGAGANSAKGGKGGRGGGGTRWEDEGDEDGNEEDRPGGAGPARRRTAAAAAEDSEEGASEASGAGAGAGGMGAAAGARSGLFDGAASIGGGSSQQSGSEGQDGASSAAGDGAEDAELVADFRRAKRLKKLSRMFTSAAAQSATITFRKRTWLLVGFILGAHLIGFSILVTQIESRYSNAHGVAMMARTTDRFQLSGMRSNIVQKCGLPDFASFSSCSPSSMDYARGRLMFNIVNLRNWHQELYLGPPGQLARFEDPRLYEYWTREPLAEHNWMDLGGEDGVTELRNNTLWVMGNKFIAASSDVYYWAPLVGADLNATAAWNYVTLNGRNSIFTGYAWSLDTFVDYAWGSLGQLKIVLVVLLVVEAICVQMTCMACLTMLIKAANGQHMRRFSVFLALPSATLRIMASRQLMVDDDCAAVEDDEELEGLDLGGAADATMAAVGSGGGGGDKADGEKKNVRMAADVNDGKGDGDGEPGGRTGKSSAKKKGSLTRSAAAAATKKDKPTTFGAKVFRVLFGWLDTKVKVNGKKLMPNSTVVLRFMAPLVLWAAAVIVVFGVSFTQLANLQGPLSSLNAAAHVTYRVSRVRLNGNYLAYSETASENAKFRERLMEEIAMLRSEYNALLYGGPIKPVNPTCLREQQDSCYKPGDEFYDITHNGLDAMITRWIDLYQAFCNLPDELVFANHSSYDFVNNVGGRDMVEGLYTAVDLFEEYTIKRFESVKTLHIILLVITVAIIAGFVLLLFRPYVRLLHDESKDIAGLLSQLPAEVDIEGLAKNIVISLPPPRPDALNPFGAPGSKSVAIMMMGPQGMMMAGGFPPGFAGFPGATGPMVPPGADGAVALRLAGGAGGAFGGGPSPVRGSWGAPPAYGGAGGYN